MLFILTEGHVLSLPFGLSHNPSKFLSLTLVVGHEKELIAGVKVHKLSKTLVFSYSEKVCRGKDLFEEMFSNGKVLQASFSFYRQVGVELQDFLGEKAMSPGKDSTVWGVNVDIPEAARRRFGLENETAHPPERREKSPRELPHVLGKVKPRRFLQEAPRIPRKNNADRLAGYPKAYRHLRAHWDELHVILEDLGNRAFDDSTVIATTRKSQALAHHNSGAWKVSFFHFFILPL